MDACRSLVRRGASQDDVKHRERLRRIDYPITLTVVMGEQR
jgi:hypothetical protein